jgi:hypothetical protein
MSIWHISQKKEKSRVREPWWKLFSSQSYGLFCTEMSKMDNFQTKSSHFKGLFTVQSENEVILILIDFLKIQSQIKSSYFKTI